MKRRFSPVAIGAFVLGAAALAIIAVMILWGGRLFTRSHKYVLYFSGDVNGLRSGAAVKIDGVQVGYVDRVLISLSHPQSGGPPILTVPVIVELSSNTAVQVGKGYLDLDNPAVVDHLIGEGLRGQLSTESLVTGILYISLSMRPGAPAHFLAPKQTKYPEIPTLPTPLQQAQELAMRALTKLGQVDLDALLNSLQDTVKNVSTLTSSPQLKAAIDALPGAINKLGAAAASIQQLSARADVELAQSTQALRSTSTHAAQALEQTQLTLKSLRDTLGQGSPLNYQLGQTLMDVSQAARAMKQLADYLNRNPSALLRGRADTTGQ